MPMPPPLPPSCAPCSWSCVSNDDVSPAESQSLACNKQASLETVHDFFHGAVRLPCILLGAVASV